VVFVADSQQELLDADVESLAGLRANLAANGQETELPMVFQYNKRDLATALPVERLQAALNPAGLPHYEAVATRGIGVEETLRGAAGMIFKALFSQSASVEGDGPPSPEPPPRRRTAAPGAISGTAAAAVRERLAAPVPQPRTPPGAEGGEGDEDPPLESLLPGARPGPLPSPPPSRRRSAPTFGARTATTPAAPEPAPRRRASDATAGRRLPDPDRALAGDGWLLLRNDARQVSMSLDDLIDEILSTGAEDSAMVWGPGLQRWSPARHVAEIAPEIPPPLPGRVAALDEDGFPDLDTVPEVLRTVLIADEDPDFRNYLAMPLRAQGFTVLEAGDGEQAWDLTREQRPWLILSDVSLPGVDGFELCRRLRAHSMTRQTPIVFISGSDDYKERYRGLQLGADDFLSKGSPIRELLIRVQLILTRYSDLRAGTPRESGMEGEIEMLSAPGVLQICHQGRFTGTFNAVSAARRKDDEEGPRREVEIRFRDGEIVGARSGARVDVPAVYEFLSWTHGHFAFRPGDVADGEPIAQSVEHLLLEGCRILDEERRDAVDDASS
jgi:DNA-binding response OmpR family regulator